MILLHFHKKWKNQNTVQKIIQLLFNKFIKGINKYIIFKLEKLYILIFFSFDKKKEKILHQYLCFAQNGILIKDNIMAKY